MPYPTYSHVLQLYKKYVRVSKAKIVDYGSGSGLFLEYFPNERIRSYVGLDVNAHSISQAKKMHTAKRISFKLIRPEGHIQRYSSQDCIISIGTLQYLTDRQRREFFTFTKESLKKNGTLILTCAIGHAFYRATDLSRFLMPHRWISRKKIINELERIGFSVVLQYERGLIFSPLFSHVGSFVCDFLDKLFFRTKGTLGPIGKLTRSILEPIFTTEFSLPLDFGYTLFLVARSMKSH